MKRQRVGQMAYSFYCIENLHLVKLDWNYHFNVVLSYMAHNSVTAYGLMKIGFEPIRQDGKLCYKKDKTVYWFENGAITGPGVTDWVIERLVMQIDKA